MGFEQFYEKPSPCCVEDSKLHRVCTFILIDFENTLKFYFSGVISMMAKKAKEKYGCTASDDDVATPSSTGRRQENQWECSICTGE